ncbi:Enzyme involved in biosynthesis of extracellular polysaccharides [Shewanella piezotolerans WP3]|uniref:Enzyme involved in biosynthesis of extracellular polysaccharides n=1 Tax=Shewanella piezotolerans (strain WP3 / JCM 13877) TaxID=225849 RepID=B8CPC2_SHEPW|nr:antibiotic biosynthesis monooxygenase [Shewanella piezotolerans]ACJ29366.1 Enzyme involved in biosynthesis of extracellular polysaccharides [Shewanella piezotolerans WP3]
MTTLAKTPKPPYYCVIFTSRLSNDTEGYAAMGTRMEALATTQAGFLGIESAREELGITVSYWQSLEAIKAWKQNAEHIEAQQMGKARWYSEFAIRISKVERDYFM